MSRKVSPEQIDQLLPQTQCGLCTHGGCMPYAKAIVHEQAPLDLCPPGGVATLQALGELMQEDIAGMIANMQLKAKPPLVALIREAECIGCTKCIAACPVDAIIGSAKSMHTVISDECTGCELCVAPCPVDCIDIVAAAAPVIDKREQYRKRYEAHVKRMQPSVNREIEKASSISLDKRQSYIQAALERARKKKEV